MTKLSALQIDGIVARSEDGYIVITWNGSATFNVYRQISEWQYEEVDVFTVYDIETDSQAAATAREHLTEIGA